MKDKTMSAEECEAIIEYGRLQAKHTKGDIEYFIFNLCVRLAEMPQHYMNPSLRTALHKLKECIANIRIASSKYAEENNILDMGERFELSEHFLDEKVKASRIRALVIALKEYIGEEKEER